MGTVIQLKKQINNSYADLKNSVDDKLILVEEKINSRLASKVELVQKMTKYHLKTGGKRLRALLTLQCAKICEYQKGLRVSYFSTNTNYTKIILDTYSGSVKDGWHYTVSARRRWADEGHFDGTFDDANSLTAYS